MVKKTTKKVVAVQEPNMEKAPKKATKATKAGKKAKVSMQKKLHVLFEARPKKFLIGQDLPPKR